MYVTTQCLCHLSTLSNLEVVLVQLVVTQINPNVKGVGETSRVDKAKPVALLTENLEEGNKNVEPTSRSWLNGCM